jgi:hypothetical protein
MFEPKLEHGHVIASAALKDPQRTPLGGDERDFLRGKNGYRYSEPAVTPSGHDAEPEIPETRKLTEPDGAVEHPQATSTLA